MADFAARRVQRAVEKVVGASVAGGRDSITLMTCWSRLGWPLSDQTNPSCEHIEAAVTKEAMQWFQ
jgi:hypothetical protein